MTQCQSCHQKSQLITKYTKLIKLFKTKCERTTKSLIKSQLLSTQLQIENQQSFKIVSSTVEFDQDKVPQCLGNNNQQTIQIYKVRKLAIRIIGNLSRKCLLKQSFELIKSAAKTSASDSVLKPQINIPLLNFQATLSTIISQTLVYGRELQQNNMTNVPKIKQLHISNFDLQVKNTFYKNQIKQLRKQIQQSTKKFIKQTQKKRESLETVAQEIRQKSDMIIELQHIIKKYEKVIGKSMNQLNIENVLLEDEEELRKNCLRLENINEKVNCDMAKAAETIEKLTIETRQLSIQCEKFKDQNKQLKQKNFDLFQQVGNGSQIGQTYKNLCQKFNKKLEKLRMKQKEVYQSLKLNSKCSSLFSSSKDVIQSKNTQTSDYSPLSRKISLKDLQAEQKIEEIFSFLFNIEKEDHRLGNEEIFDDDELALLKSHKTTFLNNMHSRISSEIKLRTQKLMKNSRLNNETDEIFYIEPNLINTQNSFFNALQSEKPCLQLTPPSDSFPKVCYAENMKLIDLEIQKSKLIEKISDLKNLHMHIRNVILNLLKSLDLSISLSSNKSQAQGILQLIFQFFQYSQDEKQSIFAKSDKKASKFWGLF